MVDTTVVGNVQMGRAFIHDLGMRASGGGWGRWAQVYSVLSSEPSGVLRDV